MNSKSLQYSETENSAIEIPALPRKHTFTALARTVIGWFSRSELEQARARFQIKRERAAQSGRKQDIVNSLSIEEKHRLGMYQLMD
ncbi:MAG: hypothetical protein JSU67_06680 [Gammaproteobacteria bacterium]|nr:MAG: hypothetical protein JSU67_06680 [Gammaproteobacteria bacterium]